MAIAMTTEPEKPIALRGFGFICVSIGLCPASMQAIGNGATFLGSSDFDSN